VPENFGCAILFDLDFPSSGNLIASVVGGFVHQLSLILDGTMYTVLYDPPLNRDDRFSGLGRNVRIPARVEGDELIIQWRDGTQTRGRITHRKQINPNRPQPA
jgi:translation initiation factor IF-1